MSSEIASARQSLEKFVRLSSELTGYTQNDLWGTGMAKSYLDKLTYEAGSLNTCQLLEYADSTVQVFNDDTLRPIARALIKLWYLGQWCIGPQPEGQVTFSVSPPAYSQSLAWRALGGHPQGARQQGYGSWTRPPVGNEEVE